jgi:FAD/FMN-containing dehydrogenase
LRENLVHQSSIRVAIDELRSTVRGRVLAPEDDGYEQARVVFSGSIDKRPGAIVRAAGAPDVARVVSVARELRLELAVRSGGHSGAGHSTSEGGLVLDLRAMKDIRIDAGDRTAWAETGLTAGEYSIAAGAHGLATGFGDTGSVGIGGLTLGGGVGYLSRTHGMTIDNLLGAEVVTADGEILEVGAESHPDLFWALRGGGGNFGVATRFSFRLHAVDQVVGGMLLLPAGADVISGFIDAAESAPDELSAIINVMPAPPLPFVPREHHGKLVVLALMCYAGETEAGQRALAPFRTLARPLVDMLRPMPYPQLYPPDDESYRPTAVSRTMFIDRVDRRLARTALDYLDASDAPVRVLQLRVLGGAIARVPADATAFAHRGKRIMANVAAFYQGPSDRPAREKWVADLAAALHQGDDHAYVNFLGDEGESRVRAAYPTTTWSRLAQVKARYDPTNFFRLNQNIPPRH